MMKFAGMRTARLDVLYMQAKKDHQNPMDLNSSPGLAFLEDVTCDGIVSVLVLSKFLLVSRIIWLNSLGCKPTRNSRERERAYQILTVK